MVPIAARVPGPHSFSKHWKNKISRSNAPFFSNSLQIIQNMRANDFSWFPSIDFARFHCRTIFFFVGNELILESTHFYGPITNKRNLVAKLNMVHVCCFDDQTCTKYWNFHVSVNMFRQGPTDQNTSPTERAFQNAPPCALQPYFWHIQKV